MALKSFFTSKIFNQGKWWFCMALLSDLKKAKRGAIAKAITIFENDEIESRKLIKKIYKSSGRSIVIGFTGSAGAGKSSLINKVTIQLKKRKQKK